MKAYQTTLIEGAIAGNKDDLEKLLQSCMKDILHLAMLHSNRQEADDIAQEVAIVLYKKINTLSDPDNFKKWLSVVVRNVSVNYMRKIYKIRDNIEYENDFEGNEPIIEKMEFLPEKYVENAEMRSIIIEEINALPKMQEICLSYFYLEEFKRADIAEVTGFSPRQVSSALNTGKQTLKKMLEQRFGKSFAYSVAPAGAMPALARAFAARRDELVSEQWCEQALEAVLCRLNGGVATPCGSGISTMVVACTVATVVAAGVAFYIYYPGAEHQSIDMGDPPMLEMQQEQDEPFDLEPEEAERVIRTVPDMIGEDEAALLTWFVENGTISEEWDSFVERIGATSERQATSALYTHTIYLLEKQNKRLLLARQESLSGEIRILYLFGDREEPAPQMATIILLFNQ